MLLFLIAPLLLKTLDYILVAVLEVALLLYISISPDIITFYVKLLLVIVSGPLMPYILISECY